MSTSNHNRYGLHGKLVAKEGKAEELMSILLSAADLVATAKGCQLYLVSRDTEDENTIWVTEVWDTREDHQNSLQMEEVRALISRGMPFIDGTPEGGSEFEVVGGTGLQVDG